MKIDLVIIFSISVAGPILINSENKKNNKILKQKNNTFNGSQKVLLGRNYKEKMEVNFQVFLEHVHLVF